MERVLEPEVMDTVSEAEDYASMDHSGPNQAFVTRAAELGIRGRVLDIGTGPGDIPLELAAVADCRIIGIDLSKNMLRVAEERRSRSPHADRVEFQIADAKRLDFETDSFDAVVSNTILHHIPEPLSFLKEAARVVKPSGTLLIRDLYRPHNPARVAQLVELYAVGYNDHQRELFRASLCAALTPGELRVLADLADLAHATLVIDTDRHMSLQIAAG